ncbi:branched-chain amino acid ABC transporter permease [Acidovorax sp. SUPP2522]|uniref:branched-chain amino acid ABC transporter permease n=1 Tax=unclassified Acidovorax TaxID=2684926 RepID=UPI00234BF5CF|nr:MULTISPECIES: branched-chain amino acid ABC transporter permease [unclassified Acidovorax]WCM97692.1 branched-chain amino acid ABC transporter permease [Acidovorax sp. GBBC 1281]GKT13295.1 branched-chain amino acid ABC transporter permease [Acidovorax sp. SUPP2522]
MDLLSRRTHNALLLAALACLAAAPFVVYPMFLMKLMCFALLAASVNLLVGYVGLLSFGHAMFYGTAGYITAHAVKVWGWEGLSGIALGAAAAAVLGLLTGLLAIRRQGIYFSMITLAFAQLVYFMALRLPFTGGEDGIQNIPRPTVLGLFSLENTLVLYYFVTVLIGGAFWLIHRLVHSPFGQVLRAIRDNEPRAQSLGYRVNRYKLLAFVLSAAIAGFAGSLKALVFQLASLTDVHWATSGEALLICIVGGMQTLLGPVVGAMVIVTMENYLASFAEWVLILQGVVFVVVVMLFRKGIVGQFQAYLASRRQRGAAPL